MTQQRGVALPLLLDVIDRLAIRYIRDRVVFKHRDARIAALFRGTNIPCEIDAGPCKAGQLLYVEQWWCCGEYKCANPNGNEGKHRKTKSYRCGARMRVRVFAGAERGGQCIVQVVEDQDVMHGEQFERPERTPLGRYDYRSKVILAEAAADGIDHISDVLTDERWDPKRIPRPVGRKEKDSLRNRFNQLLRKSGRKPRPRQRYEDQFLDLDDEDEEGSGDDENEVVESEGESMNSALEND